MEISKKRRTYNLSWWKNLEPIKFLKMTRRIKQNQRKGLNFENQQRRAEKILHFGANVKNRKTGRDFDTKYIDGLSGIRKIRYTEIKKGPKARLSKKQKEFRNKARRDGREYTVIWGE